MKNNKAAWYKRHKDELPQNTIYKIKNILHEKLGLFLYEDNIVTHCNHFYSVRVYSDLGFKIGTNGKGITREYALASAYGEFMERLQNLVLFGRKYGLMSEFILERPDSKELPAENVMNDNPAFFNGILKNEKSNLALLPAVEKFKCIPYYHVNKKKVSYLPEFLYSFTTSNGMCAGNTPEEAISQGICEILERYSIRYIYENNLHVPTIDLNELKEMHVYEYLMGLEQRGFHVLVKDCTLGGNVPVVAVVIFKSDYSKCLVNFGCDPSFEVALMRCITEAFQGYESDFEGKMYSFDVLTGKTDILSKNGIDDYQVACFINTFFYSYGTPAYKAAFDEELPTTRHVLDYLKKRLFDKGYELYVRDCSILGYPAFHVYIPGMSEFYDIHNFRINLDFIPIVRTLLTIPDATGAELEKCIAGIEKYRSDPFHCFSYRHDNGELIGNSTKLITESSFNLPVDFLLFLLCVKTKKHAKALNYLDTYLKGIACFNSVLANSNYFMCIMHYLKLKMQGKMNEEEMNTNLYTLFNSDTAHKVIQALSAPETVLDSFEFPVCGNCRHCKIAAKCKYPEWLELNGKIQSILNTSDINQENLSIYFEHEYN